MYDTDERERQRERQREVERERERQREREREREMTGMFCTLIQGPFVSRAFVFIEYNDTTCII